MADTPNGSGKAYIASLATEMQRIMASDRSLAEQRAALDDALTKHPSASSLARRVLDELKRRDQVEPRRYVALKAALQKAERAKASGSGAATGWAAVDDSPFSDIDDLPRGIRPDPQSDNDRVTATDPSGGIGASGAATGARPGAFHDAGREGSHRDAAPASADPINPTDPHDTPSRDTGASDADNGPADARESGADASGSADGGGLRPGALLRERFVLRQLIDRDEMGVVYRALDRRRQNADDPYPYVAIKVFHRSLTASGDLTGEIHRAARRAEKLIHPNIARVFDSDQDGPHVFVVMEILDGEPLTRLFERVNGAGVLLDDGMDMIFGLGRGLAHAHRHGMVHGDIRPGQVMVKADGSVKLLHFGISQTNQGFHAGSAGSEGPGRVTSAYASPEVLAGEQPGVGDDVFTLAVLGYQILTGVHPFDGKDARQARDQGLQPRRIRGLSRRQWRALKGGMAFARPQRPAEVTSFLERLEPRPSRYGRLAATAAAIGVVVVVAGNETARDAVYPMVRPVMEPFQETAEVAWNWTSGQVGRAVSSVHRDMAASNVEAVRRGDRALLESILAEMDGYSAELKDHYLETLRPEIVSYQRDQLDSALEGNSTADFQAARAELDRFANLYPQSDELQEWRREAAQGLFGEIAGRIATAQALEVETTRRHLNLLQDLWPGGYPFLQRELMDRAADRVRDVERFDRTAAARLRRQSERVFQPTRTAGIDDDDPVMP